MTREVKCSLSFLPAPPDSLHYALQGVGASPTCLAPLPPPRPMSSPSLAPRPQAYEIFKEGKHYIVQGGKVVIIDEATGRLRPITRWQDGLHQVWWVAVHDGMMAYTRCGGWLCMMA